MEWEERFWSKVDKKGDNECWAWLTGKVRDGYGQFYLNKKTVKAHRVAWTLTYGEIPPGLVVRHKCRGKCVNPKHLELGTVIENNADKFRDGTVYRGDKHPMSVLTETEVREIKKRLENYEVGMCKTLGEEYGVTRFTISSIKRGINWGWI